MSAGEQIRRIRKARNLTQKQLGELCAIAEPTIRRYELGKLNPKYETLEKIAAALHTSVGVLQGKGSSIRCKTKQWKSRKDTHLEITIDSGLLQTIEYLASEDSLSLEDEIEKLLLEYTGIIEEDSP